MKNKGSGTKPQTIVDKKEVNYTEDHWNLLEKKREKALEIMKLLQKHTIQSLIYGSITRGDVSETSDIDLFIPYQLSSFKIETALLQEEKQIYNKRIVQATPKHLVKGHIYLSEDICITFPLTSIREREFEFIKFGGCLKLSELAADKRVPGVDKRLILITPTKKGHIESPVVGFESIIAKKIGTSVELVKERVRILTQRDKVGRTGVYLDVEVAPNESIGEVFKRLIDNDPVIRRRANI
jgi:hypothetical protein